MTSPDHQLFDLMSDQNMNLQTSPCLTRVPLYGNIMVLRAKQYGKKALQIVQFLIVMVYLWAGLVEFINNPPFFDAYGDAATKNKLPHGIFENDPRYTQTGNLRLMDLPILAILLGYVSVTTWLKFEGLAWLLTLSLSIAFICFWVVNFWAKDYFDWRYYSSRMSGLGLQVSSLAICGTNLLMVLFYKRRRLPFKFKSSVPVQTCGPLHLAYNFGAIFLVMFSTMLIWFTKMYISWACFKGHRELMQICQITSQVQCYPCHVCTTEGIRRCFKNSTSVQFTCNMRFPKNSATGAFCIFNYNMSVVQFLTVFAYIGGLCVFLSTFIRLVGHYVLRVVFLLYEIGLRLCNKSSETLRKHREKLLAAKAVIREARRRDAQLLSAQVSPRELVYPNQERDVEEGIPRSRSLSALSDVSDSHYDDGFLDASCG